MVELSEAERELKRKMFVAHVTQQATIGGFQVDSESFRLTRAYGLRDLRTMALCTTSTTIGE